MSETTRLACLCGAVKVDLTGEPAARANCHCATCRDFYATPMLSATAWASENVVAHGAVQLFQHPVKQMSRAFCPTCGETVFGTNRLGMRVVLNSVLARAHDGALPDNRKPTMHLFYRHRVIDVRDSLIKYLEGWDGPTLDDLHEAMVALASASLGQQPVYGTRMPLPDGGNIGWFIHCGEYSDAPDFYQPLHVGHLAQRLPCVLDYLALPPGARFIIDDQGYEDVWLAD